MAKRSMWFEVYCPYMNGYAIADDGRSRFIRSADAIECAETWHQRTGMAYEVLKVEQVVEKVKVVDGPSADTV